MLLCYMQVFCYRCSVYLWWRWCQGTCFRTAPQCGCPSRRPRVAPSSRLQIHRDGRDPPPVRTNAHKHRGQLFCYLCMLIYSLKSSMQHYLQLFSEHSFITWLVWKWKCALSCTKLTQRWDKSVTLLWLSGPSRQLDNRIKMKGLSNKPFNVFLPKSPECDLKELDNFLDTFDSWNSAPLLSLLCWD